MTKQQNSIGGGASSPFFSIIILSYNKENYIKKCLESCINQTFKNIEIIVVDDCSQDKTPNIIQNYVNPKSSIFFIQNKRNYGTFASRIIGEQYARGKYIIHIDGDDFASQTMCEVLYPYCKTHKWDIIGIGWVNIGLNGTKIYMHRPIGKHHPCDIFTQLGMTRQVFAKDILKQAHILTFSIFPKQLPHITNLEDGAYLSIILNFSKNYLGIYECLYFYRTNLKSITASCNNSLKNFKKLKDLEKSLFIISDMISYYEIPPKNKQKLQISVQKDFYPLLQSYKYIYYYSKAYENKFFAYPLNHIQSLLYIKNPKKVCKTLTRILVYFVTLGKMKI